VDLLASGTLPPDGFVAPGLEEFFWEPFLFEGTPFALSRWTLVLLTALGLMCLVMVKGMAKPQLVPRGMQNLVEVMIDFVRVQIVAELIGKKGAKYLPYFAALFFFILFCNSLSIVPPFFFPVTSTIAIPLLLAVVTWVLFNYVGIRKHGFFGYLKHTTMPPGVPGPMYILVIPIEFVSNILLRPITLTVRLMANMMSGHLLLGLFFAATSYLLYGAFTGESPWFTALFGVGSLVAGIGFTFFEALVIFLQAYIFTLLSAVYVGEAMAEEH